jgi:putative FmdB family regulatory protein
MPIYEYACNNCEHTLDALQKMSEDPLTDCPACGKPQLKRLISAPRFRLKGAGWYETDFKKDNQRNVLKSDSESTKASADSGAASSAADSKPAKKDTSAATPSATPASKTASSTD